MSNTSRIPSTISKIPNIREIIIPDDWLIVDNEAQKMSFRLSMAVLLAEIENIVSDLFLQPSSDVVAIATNITVDENTAPFLYYDPLGNTLDIDIADPTVLTNRLYRLHNNGSSGTLNLTYAGNNLVTLNINELVEFHILETEIIISDVKLFTKVAITP